MTNEAETTDKKKTLGQMSHTDPYSGRAFGDTQTYGRGRVIAADGGEHDAVNGDEHDTETDSDATLADIAHTSPDDEEGAQRTFDRGETR